MIPFRLAAIPLAVVSLSAAQPDHAHAQAGMAGDTLPVLQTSATGGPIIHVGRIYELYAQVSHVNFRFGPCMGVDLLVVDTVGLEPLREILGRYAAERRRQPCADPLVRLRPFSLRRAELDATMRRLHELLKDTEPRSTVNFDGAAALIVVRTRNQPSAERARSILASEPALPTAFVRVEGATERAEADRPDPPPLEAYLTVLRYLHRGWLDAPEPALLLRTHIPPDLQERLAQEFNLSLADDLCPAPGGFVAFDPWLQLESGEWVFSMFIGLGPRFGAPDRFDVDCPDGDCFITGMQTSMGHRMIVCPTGSAGSLSR